MGAYGDEFNSPYSYGGGSSIIPEYWTNRLGKVLQTHTVWSRFATQVIVDVPLMQRGAGKTANWSHTTDIGLSGAGTLASGTTIPLGSNSLINTSANIVEFGVGIGVEGFAQWLSDPAYRAFSQTPQAKQGYDAMDRLMNWGVKQWDRYVGAMALAADVYFTPRSGSTWSFGTAGAGTGGTTAMTIGVLEGLRDELGMKGIAPIAQLNDTYAFVGQPGSFRFLNTTDGVQRDAAVLDEGLFRRGFVGQFGGFSFFEEKGLNAITTYSATAGTAIVLGADAIAANTNMGEEENFLVWYPDIGNDSGRQKKMNIYFLGIAALMVPTSVDWTVARATRVHYLM